VSGTFEEGKKILVLLHNPTISALSNNGGFYLFQILQNFRNTSTSLSPLSSWFALTLKRRLGSITGFSSHLFQIMPKWGIRCCMPPQELLWPRNLEIIALWIVCGAQIL
jgi:hypothetical protein